MLRIRKSKVCFCGKIGTEPIPKKIDELIEIRGEEIIEYPKVCKDCSARIKKLIERFKPSFFPDFVSVIYYRKSDTLVIKAGNEYGDRASLSERRKSTISSVKDLWTGEVVFLENGNIVGVF